MPSGLPEKTLVWCEIRDSVSFLHRAGINTIAFLVWSQEHSLAEVRVRLDEVRAMPHVGRMWGRGGGRRIMGIVEAAKEAKEEEEEAEEAMKDKAELDNCAEIEGEEEDSNVIVALQR